MRVLFLVPYMPNAIRTRPYNLIRSLARNGHEITVLTLTQDATELARLKRIAPQRLAKEIFLLREPGSGTRAAMERFLSEHGVVPQRSVEMTSNETIKQAVMAGMGISFISERTIALELATHNIARLNVAGTPLKRQWHVVHRAEKRLLPAAEAFRLFLLKESGRLIDSPLKGGAHPSAARGSSRARR